MKLLRLGAKPKCCLVPDGHGGRTAEFLYSESQLIDMDLGKALKAWGRYRDKQLFETPQYLHFESWLLSEWKRNQWEPYLVEGDK